MILWWQACTGIFFSFCLTLPPFIYVSLLKEHSLPSRVLSLMICLLHSGEEMTSRVQLFYMSTYNSFFFFFFLIIFFFSCCRFEVFEGPSFDDSARHFAVPKYPQNINIHSVGSTYFHFHISVAYSCRNHPFGKQSSDYWIRDSPPPPTKQQKSGILD